MAGVMAERTVDLRDEKRVVPKVSQKVVQMVA